MKITTLPLVALILVGNLLLSGCVTGVSDTESNSYSVYKSKGFNIEKKNKYVGAGLGILPGGGSFYTGNIGYGVGGLLLWPWSVAWEPFNGYNGSEKINYDQTKEFVTRKKESEIRDLTTKLGAGQVTQRDYVMEKQKIEDKYSDSF
jgi:hypothetical protein